MTPLSNSDHNILNTEDFIMRPREETIPTGYEMATFEVESLFIKEPLDKTIDFILKKTIRWKENPNKHSKNSFKRITLSLHQVITF